MVPIRDRGMTLGKMLDFEELATDCASGGIREFFFCGLPLELQPARGRLPDKSTGDQATRARRTGAPVGLRPCPCQSCRRLVPAAFVLRR